MNIASAPASGVTPTRPPCDPWALSIAVATSVFHLATTSGYGIFRDELYYLASSERLAWGYVDHPPMIAAVAWIVRNLLGTSLLALRLLPALAAGVVVVMAAMMARRMGGGREAQLLSAIAVALAPQYLGVFSVLTMNAVDIVVWGGLVLLAMRLLETEDHRLWLPFGLLAGIGLQNKLSILFLCFGIATGLLLTGRWRFARESRLWVGAGLALLIFAPHLVWQASNGWPTVEFVRNATATKNIAFTPAGYFIAQVRMMNPVAAPLWLGGLIALLAAPGLRRFRAIGWAYVAVFLLFTATAAKPYYLSPLYPVLFAAGAVSLERATSRGAPAGCDPLRSRRSSSPGW